MAVISNPTLPPKAGYVEVVAGGARTYRNVATGVLMKEEKKEPTPEQDRDAMLVDLAFRMTLLELGVM